MCTNTCKQYTSVKVLYVKLQSSHKFFVVKTISLATFKCLFQLREGKKNKKQKKHEERTTRPRKSLIIDLITSCVSNEYARIPNESAGFTSLYPMNCYCMIQDVSKFSSNLKY